MADGDQEPPKDENWKKAARGALEVAGGAIPIAGGLLSAAASAWSDRAQGEMNDFFLAMMRMHEEELREKQRVIEDMARRLDLQDERIAERVRSVEFRGLVRKALRDWAGAESARKQELVRNVLSNAAQSDLSSDDVIRLFLDWLKSYSEFHFAVIGDIYQSPGATRLEIWQRLAGDIPREDSSKADLYKLLIRDLSTGGVIRQHRDTDFDGRFINKPKRKTPKGGASRTAKSAFDDEERYVLTAMGDEFVHYAMNEVTIKLEYDHEVS